MDQVAIVEFQRSIMAESEVMKTGIDQLAGDDQESVAELVLFQVKECYVYMVWIALFLDQFSSVSVDQLTIPRTISLFVALRQRCNYFLFSHL